MAYDKIITIRARLDDCLRYIQDGDKTALSRALNYIEDSNKTALGDEVILQSAINCTVSNLAAFYDGFDPQDRRQALGQIQDMAQKIGGSIERAITPQVRSRNVNRNAR